MKTMKQQAATTKHLLAGQHPQCYKADGIGSKCRAGAVVQSLFCANLLLRQPCLFSLQLLFSCADLSLMSKLEACSNLTDALAPLVHGWTQSLQHHYVIIANNTDPVALAKVSIDAASSRKAR